MTKSVQPSPASNPLPLERELAEKIARLADAGRMDMIELLDKAVALQEKAVAEPAPKRVPGRFKGKLDVGPEFFEPLSKKDIREMTGE